MEFITMLIWIGGFFVIFVGASGGNLLWKAQSFLAPKEAVSPRFLDIKRPPIRWRRNVRQSFIEIGRILKKLWSNFVNTVKMDMGTRP